MITWEQAPRTRLKDLAKEAWTKINNEGSEATFEEMFGMPYAEFSVHAVHILKTYFEKADFDDPEVWLKLYALGFLLGGIFAKSGQEPATTT